MMDGQEMLAHDAESVFRQKMMDIGDAPHQRILHCDDEEIAIAAPHRLDRILEAWLGDGGGVRDRCARREIGVGARLALEGDPPGMKNGPDHDEAFRAKNALALARSAGVSTLSGTLSTRATAMLIFASSARSCSSFSRFSKGEGGKATKRDSAARR